MYLGPAWIALIKTTHRSRENVTETIEATGKTCTIHLACVTLVIGASEASPYLVFNVAILSVCLYVCMYVCMSWTGTIISFWDS